MTAQGTPGREQKSEAPGNHPIPPSSKQVKWSVEALGEDTSNSPQYCMVRAHRQRRVEAERTLLAQRKVLDSMCHRLIHTIPKMAAMKSNQGDQAISCTSLQISLRVFSFSFQ